MQYEKKIFAGVFLELENIAYELCNMFQKHHIVLSQFNDLCQGMN